MTPQIVQMLAVLADREPAYSKVYNRATGFMYARVHSHALPREQVHGPNRIMLKSAESKSSTALKEDILANLHSHRMKFADPDMHAMILIDLMDEAVAGQQTSSADPS